ncbi:TetR/AcrR family transcriptional regulator [Furfurilactobacillus sp. WILCCON 0119]|uniref:TetR/AcrR family transcriptional regulator n=1 Tax=Furfurilactobacillus entadae TaxID=2922307 RepID=UPI0035EC62FC
MEHPELRLYQDAHALTDYTDKQVQIFVAAIDVFSEKGYSNSSTKEIATRAGVSEGNIFSKFTNKRGLLTAIIDPVVSSIFPNTMTELLADQTQTEYLTLHAFLETFITTRVEILLANRKVIKILIAELAYNQATRDKMIGNIPASFWASLDQELDDLKANHMLVNWPNHDIIHQIITGASGLILGNLFLNQPITPQIINHTVDTLTKGLARD